MKKNKIRIRRSYKNRFNKKFVIFFLVLFVAFWAVLFFETSEQKKSPSVNESAPSQKPSPFDSKVKKFIQKDYQKNLLRRQMVRDEILLQKKEFDDVLKPDTGSSVLKDHYPLRDGVDLSQEEAFQELKELSESSSPDYEDIEDRIARYKASGKKLKEAPQLEESEADVDQRQVFIDQFLENAKKAGYEIELNDDTSISKVRKISE